KNLLLFLILLCNTCIAQVSSPVVNVSFSPTITDSAYSAGYVIGGVQTVSCLNTNTWGGLMMNVCGSDSANKKPGIDLYLFSKLPTGSCVNRTAMTFVYADMQYFIGKITILTSDWATLGRFATFSLSSSNIGVSSYSTKSIYIIPIST